MRTSRAQLIDEGALTGEESTEYQERFALHNLVDHFTGELKGQMSADVEKVGALDGWDDPDEDYDYSEDLQSHLDNGEYVKLGVLAAMLWNKTAESIPAEDGGAAPFADAKINAAEEGTE